MNTSVGTNSRFERMVRRMYKMYRDGASAAEVGAKFGNRRGHQVVRLFTVRSWPVRTIGEGKMLRNNTVVVDLHRVYLESGWSTLTISELCGMERNWFRAIARRRNLLLRTNKSYGTPRISDSEADAIIKDYRAKMNIYEIGRKYGKSGVAVLRILRWRGIERRSQRVAQKLRWQKWRSDKRNFTGNGVQSEQSKSVTDLATL